MNTDQSSVTYYTDNYRLIIALTAYLGTHGVIRLNTQAMAGGYNWQDWSQTSRAPAHFRHWIEVFRKTAATVLIHFKFKQKPAYRQLTHCAVSHALSLDSKQ